MRIKTSDPVSNVIFNITISCAKYENWTVLKFLGPLKTKGFGGLFLLIIFQISIGKMRLLFVSLTLALAFVDANDYLRRHKRSENGDPHGRHDQPPRDRLFYPKTYHSPYGRIDDAHNIHHLSRGRNGPDIDLYNRESFEHFPHGRHEPDKARSSQTLSRGYNGPDIDLRNRQRVEHFPHGRHEHRERAAHNNYAYYPRAEGNEWEELLGGDVVQLWCANKKLMKATLNETDMIWTETEIKGN
jgi:hypothetical protein